MDPAAKPIDPDTLVRNDALTLIVFSGDMDKLQAALTIATGAAATGIEVTVFFTFWGLNALRKPGLAAKPRNWIHRLLGPFNRGGTRSMPLSRLNFAGAGPVLLRKVMQKVGMASPEELMQAARDLGVRFVACTVTMDTLGLDAADLRAELIDEYAGVVTYLQTARRGGMNLFI